MKRTVVIGNRTLILPNVFIFSLYIVCMCGYFRLIDTYTYNLSILVIGGVSILFGFMRSFRNMHIIIAFICVYTFSGIICYFYNRNADFVEMLWPIGFMGIGTLFINFKISNIITKIIYISFAILLAGMVITHGGIENIETRGSRNIVSVFSVLFFSMNMIASYQNKGAVSFIYPAIMTIVNFLAVGRSGVMVSLLCCSLFFLFTYSEGETRGRSMAQLAWVLGAIALLSYALFFVYPEIYNVVERNFTQRGLESLRGAMWGEYIAQVLLSFGNILFGANISGTALLNEFHENLHNSFIMLHAKYGAIGLILVCGLLTRTCFRLVRDKNMYLLTPLILVFFRMNFDYTNFNGILDSVLMYYLMFGYKLMIK